MVKNFSAFLILGFLFLGCGFGSADAQEKLYFNNNISEIQDHLLAAYLRAPVGSFAIARTDLNYDGIFEFIVKSKNCGVAKAVRTMASAHEFCDFQILAEGPKGDKIVSLGTVNAYNIAGGNGSAHGVRDLIVFQNELNDFSSVIYRWDEKSSQYQMTEKSK